MKHLIPFILFIALAFTIGCSDDTEPTPTTNNNTDTTGNVEMCDTIQAVYDGDVSQIFADHCSPCHVGGASAGISIGTYDGAKSAAEQDRFLDAIKHENGANAMPQGKDKLDDATIARIECWISNGFPEK